MQGVRLVPAARDALHRLGVCSARAVLLYVDPCGSRRPIPGGEPAADALPDPRTLAAAVTPEIARARARHNLAAYDELAPSLDALAADYIAAALVRLGWSGVVGEAAIR